jgi:hypothetical protein
MDSVRFHSRAVPVSPSDKKRRSRSKAPIPSEHRQATPSKAVAVQDVFEGQSSQARHRMGLSAQSLSTAAAVFTPPKSTKFPDENLLTTHVKRELNEILNLEAYIDLIEKLSEPQPSFSASEIHSLQLVSIFIRATDKVSTTPVIGDIDYTHHFHALLESAKIPIIPILSPDIYKSCNYLAPLRDPKGGAL